MKILTLTSSFPTSENSYEGSFIRDLVKKLYERDIISVVLAPHFPGGSLSEYTGKIIIYRFRYFFPTNYERLAYGSGFANNIQRDFLAFFQIFPFFLSQFFSSLLLIGKEKPDLIHSHWLLPQGLTGAILRKISGIPHVATIHGTDLHLIKNYSVLKVICRFIIRNTDVLTVNSHYMMQQLLQVDPGCSKKTVMIPMGVDPDRFRYQEIQPVTKDLLADRIILNVGRLIDWKGTVYLIGAMPSVLKDYPNTILVIIGTGPEMDHLQKRVRELSLEGHVEFRGMVSNEDMAAYFHAADVFVLPSFIINGKTEGLGVVLLEAMASGCPVIGSNVGGIPDIIIDGENGVLVPEKDSAALAEKISQLFSDNGKREKFRRNGYDTIIESFAWERIADRFSKVYSKIIINKPTGSSRENS